METEYLKLIGVNEGLLSTEVVAEVHRGNIPEICDYLRSYPSSEKITWIIKPQTCCIKGSSI